jgi:hypothetical protein
MNLERAFIGVRYGLMLTAEEKGESELITKCRRLVEDAYREYCGARDHAGQLKLEEMDALLQNLILK